MKKVFSVKNYIITKCNKLNEETVTISIKMKTKRKASNTSQVINFILTFVLKQVN